jgi:L-fuconolactonase
MVDAHVHFWKYNPIKDAWITDEMGLLQRNFFLQDLQPVLHENGVTGIIAVQADQSENETDFLLQLSNKSPFIKGIVGWVDLQNKNLEDKLLYWSEYPVIKGFRHIVQAESDGFLRKEAFVNGIKLLKSFDFTYDILIYPNQLKEAIQFVNKYPNQKFILDHCAKPCIRDQKINEWKIEIKEIAKNENVYCKVSGLVTEAKWNEWKTEDLYPYLDVVFESFGTDRILFGSDWPVILLSSTYNKWKNLLEKYMLQFSDEEKQKVFDTNAIKFYNLNS